jgi:peptidoglycan/xylan/chitin deacetylase (PgdA/CDA1 family)
MKRLIPIGLAFGFLLTACAHALPRAAPSPSDSTGLFSSAPSVTTTALPSPSPSRSAKPSPSPSRPPSPKPSPTPSPTPTGDVPAWLIGRDLAVLPTTSKLVALTFDAGANANAVPSILETLVTYHVPATFFLTGKWVQVYPREAAQIASRYPVGNHTYDHPDLTKLPDASVRTEITQGAAAIEAVTGEDPHPMFRFPFGAGDSHVIGIANSLGYGCFRWTVDTLGWQGTGKGNSADEIVQRVLGSLQPGEIVIMHVGSNPDDHSTLDADALPMVIDALRAHGYGFTTLDRFF